MKGFSKKCSIESVELLSSKKDKERKRLTITNDGEEGLLINFSFVGEDRDNLYQETLEIGKKSKWYYAFAEAFKDYPFDETYNGVHFDTKGARFAMFKQDAGFTFFITREFNEGTRELEARLDGACVENKSLEKAFNLLKGKKEVKEHSRARALKKRFVGNPAVATHL